MRGKRRGGRDDGQDPGLIPAYAGKTPFCRRRPTIPRAHPRVCGENIADRDGDSTRLGSSPRMRGKLSCIARALLCMGLIPAYAGKTAILRMLNSQL